MKFNYFYLLLSISLIFASCAKEDLTSTLEKSPVLNTEQDFQTDKENRFTEQDSEAELTAVSFDSAEDVEKFKDSDQFSRGYGYYSFRTLSKALSCTGLSAAVFSGRKTIYAPSDAAFAKLGIDRNNVCTILTQQQLTDILLYHVVDDIVSYSNKEGCVELINGDVAQLSLKGWKRYINDSRIYLAWSQYRGHGNKLRVYAIKDVLMPPTDNIVVTASSVSDFSSLVAAVLAADPAVATALSDEAAVYTVFAPTNQAFDNLVAALGYTDLNDLVANLGVANLTTVLLYHVYDGCAFSNDLSDGQMVPTLQGETLEIDLQNLSILDKSPDPAGLVPTGLDVLTSNGIVHTVDKVLLPQAILSQL